MHASSGLTLTASGHPNIKASHAKTLELLPEAEVSPRGTCVLGVGLQGDLEALARLRGDIEIVMTCGGRQEQVRATLSPTWLHCEPLILRRRQTPLARRTLGFAADKGAADLDRGFVAALAEVSARVELQVCELGGAIPPGALFLGQPEGREDARLQTAQRLADLRLTDDLAGLESEIAAGGRVLLLDSDPSCQAEAVRRARAAGGQATLVGGWSAAAGARALSGFAARVCSQITDWPNGKPARRDLLARLADSGAALLLPVPAGQGEGLLTLAARTLGERLSVLVVAPNGPMEEVQAGALSELAALRLPRDETWLVVAGAEPAASSEALDPKLQALAQRLQAAGVTTKTLAAALAETADISKRDAFNALVKLEKI
ncbi:MAG: DUF371 domain-containing protein [Kiloniellales bacterium]